MVNCRMMMNAGASSDEGSDAGGPALPAGVLKSSTAWGDDFELQHKRERIRKGQDVAAAAEHTAVDINQFRNVEVGSGYQARHVVRQRTGNEGDSSGAGMKVRDMTGGVSAAEARSTSDRCDGKGREKRKDKDAKAKSSDKSSKRSRKNKAEKDEQNITDQYLKCKGVREFRLELEKILSSA